MEACEREEVLRQLAAEEAQKPFDLQKGPMVRVGVVRMAEREHALLMTMHHIVSDAVSMGVVVREMTALYAAYRAGQESPLAELLIQYADYAAWQRSWLKGEVLEEQTEYWKRELEGVRPLEMPTDRPLGPQTTLRSAVTAFSVGKETSARLKELSRREEATIFMTLMACFQVLLYRYSGQVNFAVGTPIAGRSEVETEGLIGFFVNTLVLRAAVGGSPSFRQVLRRMREKTLGAYGHQDIPFERLVDSLQIERNVNRTPLFQAVLAFQNEGLGAGLNLGEEVRLEPMDAGGRLAAKFELLLGIGDTGGQLVGSMEYYADLWDEVTVSRIMRGLEHLLEEAVENPGQCIDGMALLRESEQRELESGWSGGEAVEREGETLVELVREHARRGPERCAVVGAEGGGLSYGELERQSNRVGRRLQSEGVKAGRVVGICLAGMGEWLTAAVGVLKAGGAFVPLEVGEVESRRRLVVAEAGVEWVVTEERWERELAVLGVKVLKLDGEGEDEGWLESGRERERERGRGGELACVLYRSSGMGRPESIWINQRTLCGQGAGSLGAEDRVAMSLGFAQESGGLEMFRALAAGGCVVEVRRQPGLAPGRVAGLLRSQGVTVWWAEPALLERVGVEFPGSLKSVRRVLCEEGMEVLGELLEVLPEEVVKRVYGAYGGVETGGVGTLYPLCGLRAGGASRRMEMEQVAPGKRIYLLDSELRGVPEGVVGEICMGGEEQVWGYGGGERTVEHWVADTWSAGGGRLDGSGD
jgi:non-ribosomal peptide synthetase component F